MSQAQLSVWSSRPCNVYLSKVFWRRGSSLIRSITVKSNLKIHTYLEVLVVMDWRTICCLILLIAISHGDNPRRRLRLRRKNETASDNVPSSSSSNSIRVKSTSNGSSGGGRAGDTSKKLVCYYTNWSQYRPKIGKFLPEDIPADLCTHLIFAFGWMKKGKLSSFETNDETKDGKVGLYERINNLKKANPKLKTLLAIGGWSFGTQKFKEMSSTRYSRQLFVLSSIPYLRQRNFDGLDIDWEYPKGTEDKANYVLLLKELHEAFKAEAEETGKQKLLLSAAVPVGPDSIRGGYDVPAVSTYLDFINLMAYDFHGKWESQTGHNAPLYAPSSDSEWRKQLSVSHAASMWMRLGAPKEKLVIGMPTYGRSFTLSDPKNFSVNVATKGGGVAGVYTREGGFLAYYEICEILRTNKAQYVWDDEMKVPYLVDGDQWVGFDDETSIKIKMDWIKSNDFAGAMVWTVDMDDFKGDVCGGGGKYPLIKVMREEMMGIKRDGVPVDWSKHSKKIVLKPKPEAVRIPVSEVIKRKLVKDKEKELVEIEEEEEEEEDLNTKPGNIVCYFDSAALKRRGAGKMSLDTIDGSLCTILIYSGPPLKDNKLGSNDEVETAAKLLKLKEKNSELKILLSVSGDAALREMTSSVYRMNNFVYESVEFLRENQIDGIDVDWNVDSRAASVYTQLIKELRLAFEGEAKSSKAVRLLLSCKVNKKSLKNIDIEELSKYVDQFNVVTYDFTDDKLSHHSPLHSINEGDDSVDYIIATYLKDAPKEKVNVGIGAFGRTYELEDRSKFDIGAGINGGGVGGGVLGQKGFMAYYEICPFLDLPNTTLVWDNEQSVPFAYNDNQWIGFDDTRSLKTKTDWLKEQGFAGIFIYSMDLDDFTGDACGSGKFPLHKSVQTELKGYRVKQTYEGPYESSSPGAPGSKKRDPNEITCAEEDGHISYHKDKSDCTKYFMCEGERKHHMPCPAQLVFNPNENVCDWPENVEGCMAS
ncbi:unnamed protein product [Allacma fusca]|uniref:Chitinase n=1 Tax=Allacma fusca TaxID=39272 RepID=A0A8J2LK45_9HEXA|nr:unnamed protein product [Allacma fusca]